jgi:hypothetical protein
MIIFTFKNIYARRLRQICEKIPNFWLNAILNHQELQNYVASDDYECLGFLTAVDVQVSFLCKVCRSPRSNGVWVHAAATARGHLPRDFFCVSVQLVLLSARILFSFLQTHAEDSIDSCRQVQRSSYPEMRITRNVV